MYNNLYLKYLVPIILSNPNIQAMKRESFLTIRSTKNIKILVLSTFLIFSISLNAQNNAINNVTPIVTIADSVQQCLGSSGTVIIPITTEHSWNVAGISLALNINTAILSYVTVQNIHPELQSGVLLVNQVGTAVMVSWINPFAEANIGFGTMFELVFNAVPGQSQLSWDIVSQGFCEYTNLNQNILPAIFTDGNFTAWSLPTADAGPDVTIFMNDCTILTGTGVGAGGAYLWNDGSTTVSIYVCPTATTTYSVTVTDANGCTDSDDVMVNVIPRIVTIANSVQQCLGTPGSVIVPITTEHSWNVAGISLALNINPAILSYTTVQNIHPELLSGSLLVNQVGALVMVSWINPFGEANIGFGTMFELVFNAVPGQSPLSWDVTTQGFCEYTNLNQNILSADFTDGSFTAWPLPTADAGPDVAICNGDCTILAATGGVSYVWSNGAQTADITVCPSISTTYFVTATDNNGCSDVASVTVTVYPNPVADAGSDVSIYLNACTDLVATGAGTGGLYAWSSGATDAIINVCPPVTTIYSVTVTNINGCTDVDDVEVTVIPGPDITGYVNYLNMAATVMNSTEVKLIKSGSVVESTITDANGFYQFISLDDGTYVIDGASTKPWGGGNSADALMIMKHFVGMSLLTGIHLEAAEVSADAIVNTLDAMYVAQRFVGMISGFPAGDWVFEKNTVVLAGLDEVNDFGALCFGDVNASYTPPSVKVSPTITLETKGVKEITSLMEFELPIYIEQDLSIGAISLIIEYPADMIEVLDVELKSGAPKELIYATNNGELRIAYYNLKELSLTENDALIVLSLRTKDLKSNTNNNIPITLNGRSELVDRFATVLNNVKLSAPELILTSCEFSLGYNYPNPFNNVTEFEYTLAESGNVSLVVYNSIGEKIAVIINNVSKDSGTYKVQFDGSTLSAGIYMYKIEVQGETRNYVQTRSMIISE